MKFRTKSWLISLIIISILISACNMGATPAPTEDPGAIQTQAFEIVLTQAALQQNQTAAAIPSSTNTPAPTNTLAPLPTSGLFSTNTPFLLNTQQPGFTPLSVSGSPTVGVISTTTTKNGCNDGYLISESEPYDGKIMAIGTEFKKSWEFINVGTCSWDEGYTFAFIEEFSTGGRFVKDYVIPKAGPFIEPGKTGIFTVTLKTPKIPGEYIWYYKIKDDAGNFFGSLVWAKIVVVDE
jgi:hypothetical protein